LSPPLTEAEEKTQFDVKYLQWKIHKVFLNGRYFRVIPVGLIQPVVPFCSLLPVVASLFSEMNIPDFEVLGLCRVDAELCLGFPGKV
jgi:hypothetical protein